MPAKKRDDHQSRSNNQTDVACACTEGRLHAAARRRTTVLLFVALVVLVPVASLAGQQREAPLTLQEDSSCVVTDCHGELAGRSVKHRPVAQEACDACHDQDDETVHEFTYPDDGVELCYGCHESVTAKKFVHYPLKDSEQPCTSCHEPHSTESKHLLRAQTATALCLECHEVSDGPAFHRSAAVGGCTACHEPHSTDTPKQLKAQPPQLCFSCHEGLKEDLADAPVVHGPVQSDCLSCHDPHQKLAGAGLKKAGEDLCMTCHQQHFEDKLLAMTEYHSGLLTDTACLRCHEAHFSTHPALLSGPAQKLCLGCHNNDVTAKSGRTVKGLEKELTDGANLHGPVSSGNCPACHEPHGNDRGAFLNAAYPRTFYSPYSTKSYSLCFDCHDASLATEARTTAATGFRDGNVNLHYVHVNKRPKGRTCRACHATHGSSDRHMLLKSVAFGQWEIPIRFTEAENGGTCAAGCHSSKTYSRQKDMPKKQATTMPTTTTSAYEDSN